VFKGNMLVLEVYLKVSFGFFGGFGVIEIWDLCSWKLDIIVDIIRLI